MSADFVPPSGPAEVFALLLEQGPASNGDECAYYLDGARCAVGLCWAPDVAEAVEDVGVGSFRNIASKLPEEYAMLPEWVRRENFGGKLLGVDMQNAHDEAASIINMDPSLEWGAVLREQWELYGLPTE